MVSEKAGHPNQQFLEKQFDLLRVLPQITNIHICIGDPMDTHSPFNTTDERILFVEGKVMSGLVPEKNGYLLYHMCVFLFYRRFLFKDC